VDRPGLPLLLALGALAGCTGSGLAGDGVPKPVRSVLFGHQDAGAVFEGWLLVTQLKTDCSDLGATLDGSHEPGESIWILTERGATQSWEGLYPGTFSAAPGTAEARHAEVYFRQAGDVAVLTGDDAWVRVISHEEEGLVKAELGTTLAEGLLIADECGAF
jgi:hypothetical protein